MRAPVVLGAFVFCSAACAQNLSSSTNAPTDISTDKSEVRRGVSAEVHVGGTKGKGIGRKVSEAAKLLRRKVPPTDQAPKSEPLERPRAPRDVREELAERRANLRLERTRLMIKDQVAAVKEERRKL
ncbi:MAG TPA: hypothetical protein VM680_02200 [Verrucomicrobiae bacterium]|nr:hypothetical protein [Verrucomicrobiae bacterium]